MAPGKERDRRADDGGPRGAARTGAAGHPAAPPWRRLGRVLLVSVASLLVGFGVLEVALRLSGAHGRVIGIFDDFHRGDARLGWVGQPRRARPAT